MRLLNVKTLEFAWFQHKDTRPPYAIASHRWVGSSETSLKDVEKRRNVDKIGYKKMEEFARYVRQEIPALEWLWIDTCCIDQKSSPELSEAINSMFRWYQQHPMGTNRWHDDREDDLDSLELEEVISSTVSLSTLADQLGENGREVRECYKSLKRAPRSLAEVADELETFALALHNLERDRQSRNIDPMDDSTLQQCANTSIRAGHRIRSAVRSLKTMVLESQAKQWAYATLERPAILHYCDELDKAKSSLALAYQLYMGSRQIAYTTLILQTISSNKPAISPPEQLLQAFGQDMVHTKASLSTTQISDRQAFQAAPSSCSGSYHQTKQYKAKQKWRIRISPWFASRTWEFSLHVAQTGWTFNLRTANLVSRESPIWEACASGDVSEVQALFRDGKASPFDYDPKGGYAQTPLEEAAWHGHLELCRYLIEIAGFPPGPTQCGAPLEFYSYHTRIDKYANMNEAPGTDLRIYGQKEYQIWSTSHPRGFNGIDFRFDRLIFGPDVEDWAVEAYHLTTVPIYELQIPPGSFQGNGKYSVNTTHARRRAKGVHDHDVSVLWDHRYGINDELRWFRMRYSNILELRALPYEAYHPDWEGEDQWYREMYPSDEEEWSGEEEYISDREDDSPEEEGSNGDEDSSGGEDDSPREAGA
ncbi:Hypothetical predicted protein [Lecanosticta acicola]|uniref:Heterokaryon incompatibility domain-containing protein n=1 Tax=Lecanosticta acicola TaxID=111012 RepID=A0AAI9EF40_9PEZI|nr:Hypothetical predicted protein [Lecanosticta acicola]